MCKREREKEVREKEREGERERGRHIHTCEQGNDGSLLGFDYMAEANQGERRQVEERKEREKKMGEVEREVCLNVSLSV